MIGDLGHAPITEPYKSKWVIYGDCNLYCISGRPVRRPTAPIWAAIRVPLTEVRANPGRFPFPRRLTTRR
eukprot:66749-Pyramimonas_sp.AAC.1